MSQSSNTRPGPKVSNTVKNRQQQLETNDTFASVADLAIDAPSGASATHSLLPNPANSALLDSIKRQAGIREQGKRASYTREEKLAAIQYCQITCNGSLHKTAKELGIDRKRIREWISQEDSIADSRKGKRRMHSSCTVLNKEMEEQVSNFF